MFWTISRDLLCTWNPQKWEKAGKIFKEIRVKKFLNLMKTINSQIQEAPWTPGTRNMKITIRKHNIIKLVNTDDKEPNYPKKI